MVNQSPPIIGPHFRPPLPSNTQLPSNNVINAATRSKVPKPSQHEGLSARQWSQQLLGLHQDYSSSFSLLDLSLLGRTRSVVLGLHFNQYRLSFWKTSLQTATTNNLLVTFLLGYVYYELIIVFLSLCL
ncbi:hypothetical protein S83_031979 [Arachis hypogaea]